MSSAAASTIARFGDHPSQFVELWVPDTAVSKAVVVLLHGGYWRDRYDLHLMDGLCRDLADRGWFAANVEYRRVGEDGGGWPATFDDVVTAFDLVVSRQAVDPRSVVVLGHSAGGHLALWLASVRRVLAVVALAPVSDLHEASRRGLSDHAVHGLLGGSPAEQAERYVAADPVRRLPLTVPLLVVHGDGDENVPIELNDAFVAAARDAGDAVTYQRLTHADHFDVIDPGSAAWQGVVSWLSRLGTSSSPSPTPD